MVMHVQVQAEQSFVSMNDSIDVVLIEPDDRDLCHHTIYHSRDTSHSCRDTSTEHSLVAISYHAPSSILDLTKDEDEDDSGDEDDNTSVLFRDLLDSNPKRLQEDARKQVIDTSKSSKNQIMSSPFGRFSPEHFFDSLCTVSEPLHSSEELAPSIPITSKRSRTCPSSWSPNCMNSPCGTIPSHIEEEDDPQSTEIIRAAPQSSRAVAPSRLQVESDIWNLLGCTSPPNEAEFDSIWNMTTTNLTGVGDPLPPPRNRRSRVPLKDRMDRINRMRIQYRWAGATRHGVTLSKHGTFSPSISVRAASMDILDSKDYSGWSSNSAFDMTFASVMGLSHLDSTFRSGHVRSRPIAKDSTRNVQGYDSDPEFGSGHDEDDERFSPEDEWGVSDMAMSTKIPFPHSDMLASLNDCMDSVATDDQDFLIYHTVQQTLNSTWTLTWHPNADNVQEFSIPSHALSINIWMERGTVICHSGVVVEPMFMWRDAYQSHDLLQQRKRLNKTCQKPWSMRLLNTCRIAPCVNLDKTVYPLARSAFCFVVKTCQNQEFVLEAQSESQRDLICERWKLTVARFASLAVTEDIDTIAHEFFHPTLASQTLTVQPQKHDVESNENDQDGMISTSYSGSSASSSDQSANGVDWDPMKSNASSETAMSHGITTSGTRWGDI